MKVIAKNLGKAAIMFVCAIGRVLAAGLKFVGLMFKFIGEAATTGHRIVTDSLQTIESKATEGEAAADKVDAVL